MRVLAGDIGGTKTILAVVEVSGDAAKIEVERRYKSADYPGLGAMIRAFMNETEAHFERTSLAIAGPVVGNRVEATNLPWTVDGDALRGELGLGPTRVLNDFAAASRGVLAMADADMVTVSPGVREPRAPIAVLGAGTGLGESFLAWSGGGYRVVPSEGGHRDFAPRNPVEIGLLSSLLTKHAHVSYERVLSGKFGLPNIYHYLRDTGVAPESPQVREAIARGQDVGAVIGTHGVAGTDPLSRATLDLFVEIYGAEASNLAITVLARGGVFICGGVALKILPVMTDGRFRRAFVTKGRLSSFLETIPVFVVKHPAVGLLGAALSAESK